MHCVILQERGHIKLSPGHRAVVYDLLSPKLKRTELVPYTEEPSGENRGRGRGSKKATYNKGPGWPSASKEGKAENREG
jgi:hypothetical protein